MPSRRSHTKSRHGCLRCKQKRVKCDEVRPVCGACRKHGAACEFGNLTATKKMSLSHIMETHPQAHTATSSPSSTATPSPAGMQIERGSASTSSVLPPLKSIDREYAMNTRDLELLHNFMQNVTPTLAKDSHLHEMWRGPVITEAVKHPFLMHGILALSALHMVLSGTPGTSETVYKDVAMRQELAMKLYREELNEITEANCHALFTFSSIVSINAFAYPRLPGTQKTVDITMKELIDILVFIKAITVLLTFTQEWVSRGPIAALLRKDMMGTAPETLTPEQQQICDDLHTYNDRSNDIPSIKETNAAAIDGLKESYKKQWDTTSRPFLWPNYIGEDFHELLRRRHPMSLTILAYYGVLMSVCDGQWWSQGWGKDSVHAIAHVIDSNWLPAIAYPINQLGISPPVKSEPDG